MVFVWDGGLNVYPEPPISPRPVIKIAKVADPVTFRLGCARVIF